MAAIARVQSFLDGKEPEERAVYERKAYIANILPLPWTLMQTYGMFLIPACEKGEDFSLVEISSRPRVTDLGGEKRMMEAILAKVIAEDLVRQINSNAGDGSFFGVFTCGPQGPTQKQVADARERVRAFFTEIVRQADRDWSQYRNVSFITDTARAAAQYLGLERDWDLTVKPMQRCPRCGTSIRQGAAMCKECGAILDREKYEMYEPAPMSATAAAEPAGSKTRSRSKKTEANHEATAADPE